MRGVFLIKTIKTKNITVLKTMNSNLPISRRMWSSRKGFMAVVGPTFVVAIICVGGKGNVLDLNWHHKIIT